jgi:hypothetical protein
MLHDVQKACVDASFTRACARLVSAHRLNASDLPRLALLADNCRMQAQRFHLAAFGEVRRTLLYGYAYPRIATIGGICADAAFHSRTTVPLLPATFLYASLPPVQEQFESEPDLEI